MPATGSYSRHGCRTNPRPFMTSFDQTAFRRVLSCFATGVVVVTTTTPDELRGITVNAFASLSFEPTLVLVCLDELARTAELIGQSGVFAVSVLSYGQMFLADRFAGRAIPVNRHFQGVPFETARTGAPILRDCLAWLDCRVWARYAGGDHIIFIGEVLDLGLNTEREPLLYFQSRYRRLAQQ